MTFQCCQALPAFPDARIFSVARRWLFAFSGGTSPLISSRATRTPCGPTDAVKGCELTLISVRKPLFSSVPIERKSNEDRIHESHSRRRLCIFALAVERPWLQSPFERKWFWKRSHSASWYEFISSSIGDPALLRTGSNRIESKWLTADRTVHGLVRRDDQSEFRFSSGRFGSANASTWVAPADAPANSGFYGPTSQPNGTNVNPTSFQPTANDYRSTTVDERFDPTRMPANDATMVRADELESDR